MNQENQSSPSNPKRAKRKRLLSVEAAMKLPFKKRKISNHSTNENLHVDDVPLCIGLTQLKWKDERFIQDELVTESPLLYGIDLLKNDCMKQLTFSKKSPEIKDKALIKTHARKVKIPKKRSLIYSEWLTFTSRKNLLHKFKNCINFIRLDRLQSTVDIDNIVRSFSIFGKILSIQDHWVRPKGSQNQYPSVWRGATVTYSSAKDLNSALKAFSGGETSVIGVPLVEHLSRINSAELEYMALFENSKSESTSIIVENLYPRASRVKLRIEFDSYGTVLNVKWHGLKGFKLSCEVIYKSTTNAVAAALALDGKTMQRSIMRAKIKMASKELFIHQKLCEIF